MSRTVLTLGLCAIAIGVGQPARATRAAYRSPASLQHALMELAARARPGTLGVAVADLQSGRTWRVNAERAFPMMSVFKAPLGATVLALVDTGRLSLGQPVIVRRQDLVTSGVSEIARSFHGEPETFTVRQLLEAAVSHSDNTAADVLLQLVGGGAAVTAFLRTRGIQGLRVDRGERKIAQQFRGQGGYAAYLKDPRDRATPDAAAQFLDELWQGELLSRASTRRLLALLYQQTFPRRLRSGIPAGVRFADKCGTSGTIDGVTAAFNDIGILTWPDGRTVLVAAFLTASPASERRRNALFAAIAKTVIAALHP